MILFQWSLSLLVHVAFSVEDSKFPEDFLFGVSSSSYQIEGGWNEDGKSKSVWDHIFHDKNINNEKSCWTAQCSNGDISTDSYHNYKRDVQMIKALGLQFYRFSISWPRILPTGFPNQINEGGVKYYNNLIDELLKNGIKPMITIYHWDLPQSLQDLGGWANPYMVDWFGDYARTVYQLFGDRVKLWITVNEPAIMCQMAYGDNILAPAVKSYGIGNYICAKNMLLAHARAWKIYNDDFRSIQKGSVGISISMMWYLPLTDSLEDSEAALDFRAFEDWVADPIFSKEGDFPKRMKKRIAIRSKEQGFPRSRLPELSADEIKYIKGTADFFGLNAYSTYSVYRNGSIPGYTDITAPDVNILLGKYTIPSYADDHNASLVIKPEYNPSSFFTDYPPGFKKILKYVQDRYGDPIIYITENGICTEPGLEDEVRVKFMTGQLEALKQALDRGIKIKGYAVWSLMDSFEWVSGYTVKFGLYEVDFNDPKRTRVPKTSAKVYARIVRERNIPRDMKRTEL